MYKRQVLYVVDELERSLHPKLTERFLQLFMQLHDEQRMQLLFLSLIHIYDKMLETIESVRDHGVLVPALVREKPMGGYEMISGHRRKMASELAGKETMPCIVRNLSDDQAVIVMVDSNLQREEILPSEKAFAMALRILHKLPVRTLQREKKVQELPFRI